MRLRSGRRSPEPSDESRTNNKTAATQPNARTMRICRKSECPIDEYSDRLCTRTYTRCPRPVSRGHCCCKEPVEFGRQVMLNGSLVTLVSVPLLATSV